MKGQWGIWVEPTGVLERGECWGQEEWQSRGWAVVEGEEVGRTLGFSLDDGGRSRKGENG